MGKQRSESSNDMLNSMKSSTFSKGVLNRRFKWRFAYFAAKGKVGRAAARNLHLSAIYAVFAKGRSAPRRGFLSSREERNQRRAKTKVLESFF